MDTAEEVMRDRWDPFLDAYSEIRKERDDAILLAYEVLELLPKTKKDKAKKEIDEFVERITNG